jgi:hypothetical protein
MRQENELKVISSDPSMADAIKRLELRIGLKNSQFAYLIASGKSDNAAFLEVFGYNGYVQIQRLVNGDTGKLIDLLKEEMQGFQYKGFRMDKNSRLEHLLTTAMQAHHAYLTSGEAAHGAVYAKLMTTINSMTGDNAPTQVQHLVTITNQQLNDMSHSERTEAYKRMMSGKLELIECDADSDHLHTTTKTSDYHGT